MIGGRKETRNKRKEGEKGNKINIENKVKNRIVKNLFLSCRITCFVVIRKIF